MMVTFVSQCEKKALDRTRRVLDAFADRIGNSTWQTIITEEGLDAVKKLLRKTASKNTAVSCHWIRSRSRTELVWVVGNRGKFSHDGLVPVNTTVKLQPDTSSENHWLHGQSIQIVAVLAALLHDIGKATIGFQRKLRPNGHGQFGDPYRHEWISLRLFQAMIYGCKTDTEWLDRLIHFNKFMVENPSWLEQLGNDETKENIQYLDELPSLAQLIAWLIVTHHRLPFFQQYFSAEKREAARKNSQYWGESINELYGSLYPADGWVKNSKGWSERKYIGDFWKLEAVIMESKVWQSAVARWARKAHDHAPLRKLAESAIADPFVMHLSRLALMLGDHNYSSLPQNHNKRAKGDIKFLNSVAANTDRNTGTLKQSLDEHLIGVGEFTARIARELPRFAEALPTLPEKHKPFTKNTSEKLFSWQNRSCDLAKKLQPDANGKGFFGINLASTGRGKTLGNARIMYALANPKRGARFTIALGLRVLTLQTGKALRERLSLNKELLATLVGGSANKKLFDLAESEQSQNLTGSDSEYEKYGSESSADLLAATEHIEGGLNDEIGTILTDKKARNLLFTPVVTCTIDHIMSASECFSGGRQIVPILRLLTSDLVLDEPDDFDHSDLPALTRLVHFAGLFGSKVLLSSATLTPDLVAGLYQAYQAGRVIWNRHMGRSSQTVPCAWFDEYTQTHQDCSVVADFSAAHQSFVEKRMNNLAAEPARRIAEILPVNVLKRLEGKRIDMAELAQIVMDAALTLHNGNAETCPASNKRASVGLVRLANVEPLIGLVQAISQLPNIEEDVQVHLCCYHARQLLILRSNLETKLDRILSRHKTGSIFSQPEIQNALATSSAQNHVFIVVASPVAEVGRDHDYDWGIVEPSSMRSIIQLAGRIRRHRSAKADKHPNILILDSNIKALRLGNSLGVGEAVFTKPGFEQKSHFLLSTHRLSELMTSDQLNSIDSRPRISRPSALQAQTQLADLEHAVMADLLNNPKQNFVNAFWTENGLSRACVHLQKISPFREQDMPETDYVCLPEESPSTGFSFVNAEDAWEDLKSCKSSNAKIQFAEIDFPHSHIRPWLDADLDESLQHLADALGEQKIFTARKFALVRLQRIDSAWRFHPWLGFWKEITDATH